MTDFIESRKIFARAVAQAVEEKIDSCLSLYPENADCSQRHEENMLRILIGTEHERIMSSENRRLPWRKIIAIAVAAILLLTACTAIIFREEIAGFIVEFYDGGDRLSSSQEGPARIETNYYPTYIPEGYTELERCEDWFSVTVCYSDGENSYITYIQSILSAFHPHVDNERSEKGYITVDGVEILYYRFESGAASYIWVNNGYGFILNLPAEMAGSEEFYKIFEKIE